VVWVVWVRCWVAALRCWGREGRFVYVKTWKWGCGSEMFDGLVVGFLLSWGGMDFVELGRRERVKLSDR